MSDNNMGMREMSGEARSIMNQARRYVDLIDRADYDGRIPQETAARIYNQRAHELIVRRMMEDLEPFNKMAISLIAMSLKPDAELPPELVEARDAIQKRWKSIYEELFDAA